MKSGLLLIILMLCLPAFSNEKCTTLFSKRVVSNFTYSALNSRDWSALRLAITKGEELASSDPAKLGEELLKLYPKGFLVHATSSVTVGELRNSAGQLNGSANIESRYWMRSREFDRSFLKDKDNFRTLYFYDSRSEKSLSQALKYAGHYAENSAIAYYLLKSLGLNINEFSPIAHELTNVARGDFITLYDLRTYVSTFYPRFKIDLIDRIITETGEPSKRSYKESRKRKGVLLILNRSSLNRIKHFPDPETSGRFFLLHGKQALSIKDIELVIPLSPTDSIDLNSLLN